MAVIERVDTPGLDTWPKLLAHNDRAFGAKHKAMRYKHYGIWQSYSWQEYLDNVKYLALGLVSLGFQRGDRLLIVGDNAPQWYFAELAAQSNRGISVGLYSDLSAPEIERIARDCEAGFAVVEDEEQVDKISQVRDRLPALKTIVYWRYKGLGSNTDGTLVGFRDVMDMGRRYEAESPGVFEQNVAEGEAGDVCAIVYTSGTTGHPKGALHSYRSLMANSLTFYRQDNLGPKDDLVSYLPPAWINEQWLAFGCHLLSGGTVDFAESSETQQEDAREIAPSLTVYSSRLWESRAGQVRARMQGASYFKRLSTRLFVPVGGKAADIRERGHRPGLPLLLANALGDLIVFRRVRDSLGLPRARVCYSSGSTLSAEAMRFFHALGVPLKNVYGSTEAGAVTGVAERMQRRGTVGAVNPDVEVRIGDRGELLVRHAGNFLGYCADPDATARVLSEEWVSTGDRCELRDGHLVFVDRLEDLIDLPCGDEVAPQEIESRLKASPYIQDAWVFAGPQCDYLSAVVIIDVANAGRWADKHKVSYTTFGDLSQKPEVYRLIEREIESVNQALSSGPRIDRYVNLHKEFDADEAELTRNRKLRRTVLSHRYSDLVAALAGDAASVEVEADVTYQDGRTGTLKTAVRVARMGKGDR